jgi:hypothetical protein
MPVIGTPSICNPRRDGITKSPLCTTSVRSSPSTANTRLRMPSTSVAMRAIPGEGVIPGIRDSRGSIRYVSFRCTTTAASSSAFAIAAMVLWSFSIVASIVRAP